MFQQPFYVYLIKVDINIGKSSAAVALSVIIFFPEQVRWWKLLGALCWRELWLTQAKFGSALFLGNWDAFI